jgi:hypothetical protein
MADLAERIRSASAADLFDVAAGAIQAGATPQVLLGATFLAGVHQVRPRPVGGNLHSVMLLEASFRLVEDASSSRDAWLVALWALDGFKKTQREDRGSQWVLPPAPKVSFASEAEAHREFVAAMEGWEEERADRAITGLLPYHDRESLFEILWPYAARCMAYIGHKIVYGATCESVLRRIDWRHAETTARALVYGLLGIRYDAPQTETFESAAALASSLPEGWQTGNGNDPSDTEALLANMISGSVQEAQKATAAAFQDGVSTDAVWDAVRLGASELFLRRKDNEPLSGPAIRAVHPVTELWSLGHAWRNTKSESNRRVLMLTAVGWVPYMRDALLDRDAISMKGPGIAALGKGERGAPATLDELLESKDAAAVRTHLDRRPQDAAAFLRRLKDKVGAKATEYHQFKYAVAIEDESRRAHPRWASRILAPAVPYLPTGNEPDTDITARANKALTKAGVM